MNNENNTIRSGYTKAELDAATDFASFLYNLWLKSRKNEIMKMDKKNYDNNESTNIN